MVSVLDSPFASELVLWSRTELVVRPRIWQAFRCERKVRELGCEK